MIDLQQRAAMIEQQRAAKEEQRRRMELIQQQRKKSTVIKKIRREGLFSAFGQRKPIQQRIGKEGIRPQPRAAPFRAGGILKRPASATQAAAGGLAAADS